MNPDEARVRIRVAGTDFTKPAFGLLSQGIETALGSELAHNLASIDA
jgi:hypothetical protein